MVMVIYYSMVFITLEMLSIIRIALTYRKLQINKIQKLFLTNNHIVNSKGILIDDKHIKYNSLFE